MNRIQLLISTCLMLGGAPLAGSDVTSGAAECYAEARPGLDFGIATALSDSAFTAFMPALAVHRDRVLIAWQETDMVNASAMESGALSSSAGSP